MGIGLLKKQIPAIFFIFHLEKKFYHCLLFYLKFYKHFKCPMALFQMKLSEIFKKKKWQGIRALYLTTLERHTCKKCFCPEFSYSGSELNNDSDNLYIKALKQWSSWSDWFYTYIIYWYKNIRLKRDVFSLKFLKERNLA